MQMYFALSKSEAKITHLIFTKKNKGQGEAGNKHIVFLNVLNVILLSPVAHIHEVISVKKISNFNHGFFKI